MRIVFVGFLSFGARSRFAIRTIGPFMVLLISFVRPCTVLAQAGHGADAAKAESGLLLHCEFEADEMNRSEAAPWQAQGDVGWEPGFSGRAPVFRKTGASLLMNATGNVGEPFFQLGEGSIRFRFRPDWSSGGGPGHWASFLSVGAWTPDPPTIGFWALGTNPSGDQLIFSGQQVGEGKTFLRVPIQFRAHRWYDILLVYSASATRIIVDGRELGPGSGVTIMPDREVVSEYGLRIGNNHHGNQPIEGAVDGLEFFNRRRTGFVQRLEEYQLKAVGGAESGQVRLSWPRLAEQPLVVHRRRYGQNKWQTIASVSDQREFVDQSAVLGSGGQFEYQVGKGRVSVTLGESHVPHLRGRVLVVVDEDVEGDLEAELERLEEDLVGDGWWVERTRAPRHDDRRRSRYRKQIRELKSTIRTFQERARLSFNVVILVGNVPIPYSGFRAEDGHVKEGDDHRGAWPCDAYYGDLDEVWTDSRVNHINRTNRKNSNRPGDGRFDQDYLPSSLELAVSRIDFSNLPALTGESLPDRPVRSREIEVGLLRRYLDKNHAYRMGKLRFDSRAVFQSYLPSRLWQNMDENAFRNASALYGLEKGAISEEDCFLISKPVEWAFLAGFGGRSSLGSGRYQTTFLNQDIFGPQAAFLMLYSSWSGDWNLRDSFTKATLTKPSTGLAVMSSIHGQWQLSSLALGEPLATAYFETANEVTRGKKVARSISILGDATLRMYIVPPVQDLSGKLISGRVRLSWRTFESGLSTDGVYVYRSKEKAGPYRLISGPLPLDATDFTDAESPENETHYMVRQTVGVDSPAGRHKELSQGKFWVRTHP